MRLFRPSPRDYDSGSRKGVVPLCPIANCSCLKRREIFPSAGSVAEGGKFLPLLHLLTSV